MFTKKYLSLIGLVFLLLIASGIGVAPASAATNVSVSPSTQTVSQGESFSINVSIEPDTAIAGAQCNLQFNSSLVQVNSVAEGELFKQKGANTVFIPGTIDNTSGVVTGIYGFILNTEGAPKSISTPGTFAIISLTANNTAAGTSPLNLTDIPHISVIVSSPEGTAVSIEVINGTVKVNRAPVLNPIGDKSVDEGQTVTFSISASDLDDDDPLTYSASNLPGGANFNPATKTFSWTPSYDQVGTYPNVHFEVSDGHLTDSEDIMITVNDVNRAPVLNPIGDKSVDEGQTLTFTISASDLDDDDPLTYSASNLPGGANFNPATKTFSWTPSYFHAGSYQVYFEVNDIGGLTDSETIAITVNNAYPPYDINKDSIIDVSDLTIVGQYYGEEKPSYDLNDDGVIDIMDLLIIGQHFGEVST